MVPDFPGEPVYVVFCEENSSEAVVLLFISLLK